MTPAAWPRDDALAERMMVVDRAHLSLSHATVGALPAWLAPGDLLVVNDAATLPASLSGRGPSGVAMELRLAGPATVATPGGDDDEAEFHAVLFGEGDWHTRTEDRRPPPDLAAGDVIVFADDLRARVSAVSPLSPRLVTVRFSPGGDRFWQLLYAQGRPVQYSHVRDELPLWHAQTVYAGRPWAVENPSAGRPLRWSLLQRLHERGIAIARVTHAAGLSATGDAALDAMLPLPERYDVPAGTVDAIARTRARGGRVVAVGTSVVRCLEGSAASHGALVAGVGVTDLRLGEHTRRHVVDAILSGIHEPGTTHFELLTSFAPRALLLDAAESGASAGYLGHEFGDACLVLAA